MSDSILLPAAKVRRRYSISLRSIYRWVEDTSTNFPAPLKLGGRLYWRENDLAEWERNSATSKQRKAA